MTWNEFIWFAIGAAIFWIAGASVALKSRSFSRWATGLTAAGVCIYTVFIVALWIALKRPPLRTLGETRLWYSFFIILSGLLTYRRWHYRWILLCSTVISLVFVIINILKPEIHDQSLMPALQSFWFIPHVTVYIFSYSVLGCAFILAMGGWIRHTNSYFPTIDRLVYIGMASLTLGMMSGAMWAKVAWGNFWSWDPKETWAAITWCIYLLYIHLRLYGRGSRTVLNGLLAAGFLCMQMCWYGVNYLPTAQSSMHVY